MNAFLSHRRVIRLILIVLTILLVLTLNIILLRVEDASKSVLFTIALPAMALLTEFLPEIVTYIRKRTGPSEYSAFVSKCMAEYRDFLREYFLVEHTDQMDRPKDISLFSTLQETTLSLDGRNFGSTNTSDRRRKPIPILLFIIRNGERLQIDDYENLSAFIKITYKSLTDLGKKEFVYSYDQLVLQDKHFVNPDQYFATLDDDAFEASRLRFYDRYMKDDYIGEIAALLKLNEGQIRSFKESVKTVAESDRFNLKYLKDFVQKRKTYKKLYIVTADIRFSKRVQAWIRQQPHFILNYSSITNLPRIGISDRFDIFFFSPEKLIPSAAALYEQFLRIDPNVNDHPVRIFEVDPSEGFRSSLSKSSSFAQAISYFEASTFDPAALEKLSYQQLLSILEKRKVSLQTVISDLPPSEFSTIIFREEKDLFNRILSKFIEDEDTGVFNLTKIRIADIRQAFVDTEDTGIPYSDVKINELFAGKITEARKRERVLNIFRDTKQNLELLDEFIM